MRRADAPRPAVRVVDAARADADHALEEELAHRPSPIECARRLRAAYEASVHDDGQRMLLRELMAHYRAWCLEREIADPFAPAPERAVPRVAAARADAHDVHADQPSLHDLVFVHRRPTPASVAEAAARSLAPVTRAAG